MDTSFQSLKEEIHSGEAHGRLKILIIGHGGHGKDTVARGISEDMGYRWTSSSRFIAKKVIFPLVSDLYPNWQAAYSDRASHREMWFHAIRAYNLRPGPMLAEQILMNHEIYVGMRSRTEFERSRALFDLTIWVDRSDFLRQEPPGSMELNSSDADRFLDNNGSIHQLKGRTPSIICGPHC